MLNYESARKFICEAAKTGSILGLESIRLLMEELSNVQDDLPIIHIAGTNGKGSTGAYLASILKKAGFRVGRYTSPAVFNPLEVWQFDGKYMTKNEYASVVSQVKKACDIMVSKGYPMPTVFEIETAMAFVWFSTKNPDVILLETGMGGATDATNIICSPLACVFTTISRDHMHFLGESLAEIAEVKAGIMKNRVRVFSIYQDPEVEAVLLHSAKDKDAQITFVKEADISLILQSVHQMDFLYQGLRLVTQMPGIYQLKNATLAVEIAKSLFPQLSAEIIADGIAHATWQGRFEVLGTNPLFVIDGAHNEDAAKELQKTMQNCFTNKKPAYIIGVLADKEHEKMLAIMLPYAECVYTVTPNNSRAMNACSLAKEARKFHTRVEACQSIEEAVDKALQQDCPVLAFGSLSYLGELKRIYESRNEND